MKNEKNDFSEKSPKKDLSDFIVPSFLAHINRIGKQERKMSSKAAKLSKKKITNIKKL